MDHHHIPQNQGYIDNNYQQWMNWGSDLPLTHDGGNPSAGLDSGAVQHAVFDPFWNSPGTPVSEENLSSSSNAGSHTLRSRAASADKESPQSDDYRFASRPEVTPHIVPFTRDDPILDLRTPTPPRFDKPRRIGSKVFWCPLGCSGVSFGRSYEMKRHIKEQHRCPHEACANLTFGHPKEKAEHDNTLHGEGGLLWRCGTCELTGSSARAVKRAEKLKKHFIEAHGLSGSTNIGDLCCRQKPCFQGDDCGGLFFACLDDLKEHISRDHTYPDTVSLEDLEASNDTIPLLPLFDYPNAGAKHALDQHLESESKRSRINRNDSALSFSGADRQPPVSSSIDSMPERSTDPTRIHLARTIRFQQLTSLTQESASVMDPANSTGLRMETLTLTFIELHTLTKQDGLKAVIADLKSLKIRSTFDCKQAAVKLRGECSQFQMEKGKTMLLELINRPKVSIGSTAKTDCPPYTKENRSFQQVSIRPQGEISALHPKEDEDVLALWNNYLVPEFPRIVKLASVKGKYSVAMVRQNVSNGIHPVIRFRSSENQGSTSRQVILERVKDICGKHNCLPLTVQFSSGSLVRLVGSPARPIDDPPSDVRFPHQRRYWKKPGMGASIGLSNCHDISATLGGWILLDGRMHLMSVDHFISECRCPGISDKLRSPSISDIEDVRLRLKKKIEDLELRISLSVDTDEISLDDAARLLFPSQVDDEIELYKRFELELEGDFGLGKVLKRCGGDGDHPLRPPAYPRSPDERRRMDWSLTAITNPDRQGKNVHRHGRIAEPSLDDLGSEVTKSFGSGVPCEQVEEVRGGEHVHYVGTTSGFREGIINPATVVLGDEADGPVSHEWAMVVPGCETLTTAAFKGDSGAWIVSDDNKLKGLLWGWDNGLVLFTPMQDVFADIKRITRGDEVRLPDFSTPQRRRSVLLCRQDRLSTGQPTPERLPNSPVPAPSPRPLLLSPTACEEPMRRRRSSSVSTNPGSPLSTIPSLVSVSSLASSTSSTSMYDLCSKKEQSSLEESSYKTAIAGIKRISIANDLKTDGEGEQPDELMDDWDDSIQLTIRPRIA